MFVLEKMTPFFLQFFKYALEEQKLGKNWIFQDNIRMWVLKMFMWKKKTIPFCLAVFQIQLLVEEGGMGQKLHFLYHSLIHYNR